VQEALTNVIRHAQACTCHIQLSIGDSSELCLEIEDDGRGLSANHRAGVGCQSMRERASELGGEFVLEAPAGGGTRLYARLPLLAEET
jgi:signal transduction histidine kinase